MPYTVEHSRKQVTALTPEQHEKTCNYWYTVTSGATAHTAFTTKAGLMRWLDERGLTLDGELPETRGEWANTDVAGEYLTTSHGEFSSTEEHPYRMVEDDAWHQIAPVVTTWGMSNGRYTVAKISEDNGVRTVHILNPNVKSRTEATDSAAMRALMA